MVGVGGGDCYINVVKILTLMTRDPMWFDKYSYFSGDLRVANILSLMASRRAIYICLYLYMYMIVLLCVIVHVQLCAHVLVHVHVHVQLCVHVHVQLYVHVLVPGF